MADLTGILKDEKIQSLRLGEPLCVPATETVRRVLSKMRSERRSYAVVTEGRRLLGIFTDRDALKRMVEQKTDLSTPIEQLMTKDPEVLKKSDSIATAIRVMNEGHYRHIPILRDSGEVEGMLGVRDIVAYLAEHFPYEVYNLPPDPRQILKTPEGA